MLKKILKKICAGFIIIKPVLSTLIVLRKQILILILFSFCIYAGISNYYKYSDVKRLKKTATKTFPIDMYYKHEIGTVYEKVSKLLIEKDILLASDQKLTSLKKKDKKVYLLIDYNLALRDNFIDFMEVLDQLSKKKLIQNIDSITIEKNDEKNSNLDIKLDFKAIAYDKLD